MKTTITKNLLLGLLTLTLGACGADDNQGFNQVPYYPGTGSGLACSGMNAEKLGVYVGNLGNGAAFAIDIYLGNSNQIAAVGDIYIPDLNRFWNPGMFTPVGSTQQFVSCLTSNGFTGSLVTAGGTGAYRNIEIGLQGTNIAITLGSGLPDTFNTTQIAGNNIVGPVYIQMNGAADTFVLTDD